MRRSTLVVVALSLLPPSTAALAQRKAPGPGDSPLVGETFEFLVGGDLLGQINPAFDPVITEADNGDRLEVRGEGDFTTWPKRIFGAGSFVHKDALGNELGRGSWIVVEYLSFHYYGGSNFAGGQLQLRIDLIPEGRSADTPGKMQVDSPFGNAPPSSDFEARVVIQDTGLNFNKRVQGLTVFIKEHTDPPL